MIEFAAGVGRSPVIFQPVADWPATYERLRRGREAAPESIVETREVLEDYARRIELAFQVINAELRACEPDTLLLIGDDNLEVFNEAFQPSLNIFCGAEVWGYRRVVRGTVPDEAERFSLRCNPELAKQLLGGLVDLGFDFSWNDVLQPLGSPDIGIGHAFTAPVLKVLDGLDIPIIPLTQNVRHKPIISARRCYDLGRALNEVLATHKERVAVLCTGGLSIHWIDEALDRWVLGQIELGEQGQLSQLFLTQSGATHVETGEIRNWITMSATLDGVRGRVVDYIPCYHGVAGLAFAYLKR